MAIKTFPLTLKWTHMVAPGVRHFVFERENGEAFSFIPGQFISIHFTPEEKALRRSYSVATIPGKSEQIEFAASFVEGGAASQYLFALEPGQKIEASGPYGRLVLREDDAPSRFIMVATGTGVTPYRSMLPEFEKRLNADPNLNIVVMLGVRTHNDQLYAKDFLEFAENHPRFEFHVYFSREYPDNPASHEHSGYVQMVFPDLDLDPDKDLVYLCGNPNMIDNAVDLLKEKEFTIQKIRREKYIS